MRQGDHRRATRNARTSSQPSDAGIKRDQPAHRMGQQRNRGAGQSGNKTWREGLESYRNRRNADMAYARIPHQPVGAALPAPVEGRHGKAARRQIATVSKYFSMNSARPCSTQTVPFGWSVLGIQ